MRSIISDFLHFFIENQWAMNTLLVFVCMLFFHWISRRLYRFLLSRLDNGRHVWAVSLIKSVHMPWLLFFWVVAISIIVSILMKHFHLARNIHYVNVILSLCFIVAFYISLLSFITKVEIDITPRSSRRAARDKTTVRALAQLSRVVLTIIVILMILPLLGFETSSLLAFGGVGALGVTYAAKDTLSNFLGGMMIFLDRPFSVGDSIRSPDRNIEGTVEHIGWRLTRIRATAKRALYVPNAVFSMITIENSSRMSHRHINVVLGVRYDDVALVEVIAEEIERMLQQHPGIDTTQNVMAHMLECAASSLNINIYAFTKTTDLARSRQVQQDILLKAIAIIEAHGAECAFPTTTVLLPDNNALELIDERK